MADSSNLTFETGFNSLKARTDEQNDEELDDHLSQGEYEESKEKPNATRLKGEAGTATTSLPATPIAVNSKSSLSSKDERIAVESTKDSKGKITYLVVTPKSKKMGATVFWVTVSLLIVLLVVVVLSIAFFATQAPHNLGPLVCCSPKNIWLGQYLQSGNYIFKLFGNGNMALQQKISNSGDYATVWETGTGNQNVAYAQLTTTGTLVLVNTNGSRIWSTSPPADPTIGPFLLVLNSDGHLLIRSSTDEIVYDHPPSFLANEEAAPVESENANSESSNDQQAATTPEKGI